MGLASSEVEAVINKQTQLITVITGLVPVIHGTSYKPVQCLKNWSMDPRYKDSDDGE